MKNICIILCLLSSLTNAQPYVAFRDDFNDNKNGWPAGTAEGKEYTISNGKYTIKNTSGWWYYVAKFAVDPSQDYTIEAKITQVSGKPSSQFGIVWQMYDNQYYQSFVVNTNNNFNAYYYDKGKVTSPSGDKTMNMMKPMGEANIIQVKKTNDKIAYVVNGTEVFTRKFAEWYGNWYGFMISDDITIDVDHFEIRQDHKPEIHLVPGLAKGFTVENLGPNINGPHPDISPLISADGKTLYFSKYSPENIGGDGNVQDAYYSLRQPDGSWGKYINAGRPINNEGPTNIVGISADNNTALCMNTYGSDGKMYAGASVSKRTATGWELPTALKFDKFDTHGDNIAYSLSAGGDILVMELERDTSMGGDDLYVSFKKPDGSWTEPMHLGPDVNTPAKEITPFLAPDDRTLYFSTNGLPGYGSSDIYLSRRLDDSWKHWSMPENLGPDVNTDDWDAYFTVPASGEYAYYSSQKNSLGGTDIVRIKLPDAAKPLPLFLVSGKTYNAKTKQPIEATIQYESLPDGNAVGSATSTVGTGEYTIALTRGKRYGFRAEKEGFFPVSDNLDATKLDKYTEVKKDLYLVPVEVGEVVRINNVFFDFGKFDLRPESYPDLKRLASFMKSNASVEIQLLGHTDNVGKDADNIKLSENRIQSVKAYLVAQGIDASRMSAKGYGKSKPIATNDTDEGRQQNRRVEFTIVKK
jgi:outer membrane protein OmpA-like peptidoglycan-associated protein